MAATKIILKRSSILGKRPNSSVIEPGEVALNTNAIEPGMFFEAETGNIVKVGPTAVGPTEPVQSPALGETWYNTETGSLNVGTEKEAKQLWRAIASPFLGGEGQVVFVAPEFPYSSDSTGNDGQTLPYQTLSRAILELSKKIIKDTIAGIASRDTVRYMVYYAPSRLTANNGPGVPVDAVEVGPDNSGFPEYAYNPTISELQQFNTETGGLVIPRGITIKGMDLKKCELSPTYVPSYRHPVEAFGGINQPITSILKLSGNSYLENFSVVDKITYRQVDEVSLYEEDQKSALFKAIRPHGLEINDRVDVVYSSEENQEGRAFVSGLYYAHPVDTYTFLLSINPKPLNQATADVDYIPFTDIVSFSVLPENIQFQVTNSLKSAHRLRVWQNVSKEELAKYYEKVQKAFPAYFGGKITIGANLVGEGEYVIVGPTSSDYPNNTSSNTVKNSSAYVNQVNLRSEYGMCAGEADGDIVEGFRSVIVNSCTAVTLQRDPAAYEVYDTFSVDNLPVQKWWPLAEAKYRSMPENPGGSGEVRPSSITQLTDEQQMLYLNQVPIDRIRYSYSNIKNSESGLSIGIVDIDSDFRHFGFRALNSAYMQAQSIYTIGCAVGVWALNGGYISLTNSTSNFGSVAFKSEGFRGVGSNTGAYNNSRGFLFDGIQTPLALTRSQVEDNANKHILSLGAKVADVYYDNEDPGVQIVELDGYFLPCYILPFSLRPGSAVWVSSGDCTYRGFFTTDGGPTIEFNSVSCSPVKLRLRASDSTIPTDPALVQSLDIPYIRRFRDPRDPADRAYNIVLRNTGNTSIAPGVGSVLRLDTTAQGVGSGTIKPNVQFDPGSSGGWGRVFTVDSVLPATRGLSPNFNYVIGDAVQDNKYIVTITATDLAVPWDQQDNNGQGSYVTYKNKNWYAAENNIWNTVYYGSISPTLGPAKIAPTEQCSPFVNTSVLEKQDAVGETYQGDYAKDPKITGPTAAEYNKETYLRGATLPYTEFSTQFPYDNDDGSEGLGIVLRKTVTNDSPETILVSEIKNNTNAIVQKERLASPTSRYRPEIVEFYVLSSAKIPNPRQTVSVLRIGTPRGSSSTNVEYFQVIELVGTQVKAIRLNHLNSMYPATYLPTDDKPEWNVQTPVVVCSFDREPTAEGYDPYWSNTKKTMLRFLRVMGYTAESLANNTKKLAPNFWGQRLYGYQDLPVSPSADGYAVQSAAWPIEFNQPSTVVANTHTWAYCGYPFYSRGLPKYQTNEISRKLSYDFQSYSLWGGRLTVTGINDKGELVSFGPQREAVTAQYYEQDIPMYNLANQQVYEEQTYVEFPGQVVVYSTDNISGQFNGTVTSFELKKGGTLIPPAQLSQESLFVQLGAITQIPGVDYTVEGNLINFSVAPLSNSICDIRVVTSEDNNKTLIVVPFVPVPNTEDEVNQTDTMFTFESSVDIKNLTIDEKNTFVFLGGVEQIPTEAYTLTRYGENMIRIVFNETVPEGVYLNVRAICSGSYWENQSKQPVSVYSLDSISPDFDNNNQTKVFPLTYEGKPVNPSLVNTENLFVAVGGVMQLPYESYTVDNGFITFSEAPFSGSTSNLRVVTNAEFLPCTNSKGVQEGFLSWGPSLVVELANNVNEIKNSLG